MGERCETCQHWSFAEPDWEFDDLRFGRCVAIKQRSDIEDDAAKGLEWADEPDSPYVVARKAALLASKAIAVDGSGYYAAVRTQADFGCVLHAPIQEGGGR